MIFVNKYNEAESKNSLIKNIIKYKKNLANNSVLYDKNTSICKNSFNFINMHFSKESRQIKNLIDSQVIDLERYSEGLGEELLDILIDYVTVDSGNIFKYNDKSAKNVLKKYIGTFSKEIVLASKEDIKNYIDKIESVNVKEVMSNIVNKCDIEDQIYVESHNSVNTIIKRSNNLFFDIEFDIDFLGSLTKWGAKDYKYIVIDGFIDRVSEIHHLLHKASEDKEPYVIFCKGMHEEVKKTIIQNNIRKTINVMPVSFSTNEESINILNDIASCHNGNIVSSIKGDVISVEVRRDLPTGRKISINRNGFYIECIDQKRKNRQLNYLNKRIKNSSLDDPNREYLKIRSKNLNSKKVMIYLGTNMSKKERINLDGHLRKINLMRSGITYKNNKIYTKNEIVIILKQARSFLKTISSLSNIIILERKNE